MKTISPNKNYIYHSTQRKNVNSILEQGITSIDTSVDSQLIIDVLKKLDYEDYFPFCRTDVNYFGIHEEFVEYDLNLKEFDTNSAFIVVDVRNIDSPMYIADMSLSSKILDYACAGEWILRNYESIEEVIHAYKKSIFKIDKISDIYKYDEKINGTGELIIDGDIPPEKIVNVIQN